MAWLQQDPQDPHLRNQMTSITPYGGQVDGRKERPSLALWIKRLLFSSQRVEQALAALLQSSWLTSAPSDSAQRGCRAVLGDLLL